MKHAVVCERPALVAGNPTPPTCRPSALYSLSQCLSARRLLGSPWHSDQRTPRCPPSCMHLFSILRRSSPPPQEVPPPARWPIRSRSPLPIWAPTQIPSMQWWHRSVAVCSVSRNMVLRLLELELFSSLEAVISFPQLFDASRTCPASPLPNYPRGGNRFSASVHLSAEKRIGHKQIFVFSLCPTRNVSENPLPVLNWDPIIVFSEAQLGVLGVVVAKTPWCCLLCLKRPQVHQLNTTYVEWRPNLVPSIRPTPPPLQQDSGARFVRSVAYDQAPETYLSARPLHLHAS